MNLEAQFKIGGSRAGAGRGRARPRRAARALGRHRLPKPPKSAARRSPSRALRSRRWSRSIRCWRSSKCRRRRLAGLKVGDPAEVRLVNGQKVMGRLRYVAKTASATTRTYRVEVEMPNPEQRDSGRHHRRSRDPDGAGAGDARAALGADLLVGRRSRRARRRGRQGRLLPGRADRGRPESTCGSPAFRTARKVIVQGQDFVREGQTWCDAGRSPAPEAQPSASQRR